MAYNEQASLDEDSRRMTALLEANKRIAELEAALHQMNALNDSPARFNKEIQDVLNSVIDTSDIKFERK